MNLLHYSAEPLGQIRSTPQSKRIAVHLKPKGLWVSVEGDNDWREWCLLENFRLDHLTHVHEITLADDANILRLAGPAGIDAFTSEFGIRDYYGMTSIHWGAVANQYQGIIIAPYVWSRRLDGGADWYYGWDCASGCIWDASAVAGVTLREVAAVKEPAA